MVTHRLPQLDESRALERNATRPGSGAGKKAVCCWPVMNAIGVFIVVVGVASAACNGPPPPPPPPPTTTTTSECPACDSCCPGCPECLKCPDGYELIKEDLVWRCESTTTTTTTTERRPEDYITLSRGQRIIHDVDVESRSDIYLSIHSGVRDEEYAATYCTSIVEGVLGLSAEELFAMAEEGLDLINQWERKWRRNLSTVNKRCEEDERFCQRSDVLKKNWAPYVEQRLRTHRAAANRNRELAKRDPLAECDFDSVAGWCQCRLGKR